MYNCIFNSVLAICLTIAFCVIVKWYYVYKTNSTINQLRCILSRKDGIIDAYINIINNLVSENTALRIDNVKGDNDTEENNDSEDNK